MIRRNVCGRSELSRWMRSGNEWSFLAASKVKAINSGDILRDEWILLRHIHKFSLSFVLPEHYFKIVCNSERMWQNGVNFPLASFKCSFFLPPPAFLYSSAASWVKVLIDTPSFHPWKDSGRQGFNGVTTTDSQLFPSCHQLFSHYVPDLEKKFTSFSVACDLDLLSSVGTILELWG